MEMKKETKRETTRLRIGFGLSHSWAEKKKIIKNKMSNVCRWKLRRVSMKSNLKKKKKKNKTPHGENDITLQIRKRDN